MGTVLSSVTQPTFKARPSLQTSAILIEWECCQLHAWGKTNFIGAVAAFPAQEDAEKNAALMAINYIDGGLAEECMLCMVTRAEQAALSGCTPVQVNSPALSSHAQLVKVLEERKNKLCTRQACPVTCVHLILNMSSIHVLHDGMPAAAH